MQTNLHVMVELTAMKLLVLILSVMFPASLVAQNQAIELAHDVNGGVVYQFDPRMVPATGLTVEAWITYDDAGIPLDGVYRWPTIARQNTLPFQESWNFRVNANNSGQRRLAFLLRATNNIIYTVEYPFAPGEFASWTHVAATFDGQVIRLFKNAVEVQNLQLPIVSEVQDNGGELYVGDGDNFLSGYEVWNGGIDELRIWPMARTSAELAATMTQELQGMPGDLLVFPFNGGLASDDGSLPGSSYGSLQFVSAPALQLVLPSLFSVGPASASCLRKPHLLAGSAPQIGNQAFALTCVRGPVPAVSPFSVLFAGASYVAGVPSLLGVVPNIDPQGLLASAVFNPAGNQLGNARFAFPIPNQASLIGAGWVFQWLFYDPICGAQGFTASNGLLIGIQ